MIKEIRHVWCGENDRWLYLEFDENEKIIGINFCQGDEYGIFKEQYTCSDERLTEFYNIMVSNFNIENYAIYNVVEFVNKVCWTYHEVSCLMGNKVEFITARSKHGCARVKIKLRLIQKFHHELKEKIKEDASS